MDSRLPTNIFYKATTTTDYKTNGAISNIVVCTQNVPSGYEPIPYNIGTNDKPIRLAYKRAVFNTDWVIDFIGAYEVSPGATQPVLPQNDSYGRWEWVKMAGTNNIGNLNTGFTSSSCPNIYLIVHKTHISFNK